MTDTRNISKSKRFFRMAAATLALSGAIAIWQWGPLPGAGPGMSLVAAVAGLHHAELFLEDNQPGLRVVVSLATW